MQVSSLKNPVIHVLRSIGEEGSHRNKSSAFSHIIPILPITPMFAQSANLQKGA